jgi:hypothetical protein
MSFLLEKMVDENYAFKRSQRTEINKRAKTGHLFKKPIQFIGLGQSRHLLLIETGAGRRG